MIKNLYALFDKAADLYSEPVPMLTDGLMVRTVTDMIAGGKHPVSMHPSDFSIVCVGEWNERTGTIAEIEPRVVTQCDILKGE